MGHDAIVALYKEGMTEAKRVLKDGGLLFVKCQDEIVGSSSKVGALGHAA
jgi:hypothetical protein